MWDKEKLLFTSNFSFSHSVLKRSVEQTHKIQGLFWKVLTLYHTILTLNDPEKRGLWKTLTEKRENAGNTVFLLLSRKEIVI